MLNIIKYILSTFAKFKNICVKTYIKCIFKDADKMSQAFLYDILYYAKMLIYKKTFIKYTFSNSE